MPFTPFHMGPGIVIKAIMQGHFSLIIFGWAQILMDIQPLVVLLTGKGQLHGFSHTYAGATLIAVVTVLTGKWIYGFIMMFIRKDFTEYQKRLFAVPGKLTAGVCIASAFIGTYSHVLLDSIMHGDMQPYYPLDIHNALHLLVSVNALYLYCVIAGAAGAGIYFLVRYSRMNNN